MAPAAQFLSVTPSPMGRPTAALHSSCWLVSWTVGHLGPGLLSLSGRIPLGTFLPCLLLSSSRPEFKWCPWLGGPCSASLMCFQFPVSLKKFGLLFSLPILITVGNGIFIRMVWYLSAYHWKPMSVCSVLIPSTQHWAKDMLKKKPDECNMQGHHGSRSDIKNLGVQSFSAVSQ